MMAKSKKRTGDIALDVDDKTFRQATQATFRYIIPIAVEADVKTESLRMLLVKKGVFSDAEFSEQRDETKRLWDEAMAKAWTEGYKQATAQWFEKLTVPTPRKPS